MKIKLKEEKSIMTKKNKFLFPYYLSDLPKIFALLGIGLFLMIGFANVLHAKTIIGNIATALNPYNPSTHHSRQYSGQNSLP